MKKVILSVAVVIALVSTSCTKSHTCTCVDTPTTGTASTTVRTYDKITTANGQQACEEQSYQDVTTVASTTTTGDKIVCTFK